MTETKFKPGGKLAWLTLILLIFLYCSDFIVRMVWSVSMEAIKADFNFSDTEIGMLQSIFFIGLGGFTIPVSIMVDRWSRKKSISLMAFFWSLGSFATALSGNFFTMLSSRLATGMGVAGFAPAAFSWVSDIFPQKKRATAIGLLYIGMIVGCLVGMGVGGAVITKTGDWKIVYYAFGIPGLVLSLVVLFIPDPRIRKPEQNQAKIFTDIKDLFKIPSYKFTALAAGFYMILAVAVQTWAIVLMMRAYNLTEAKAGAIMGAMIIPALLAPVFGGTIADRMQKKRPHGRPLYCATFGAISILGYAIMFSIAGSAPLWAYLTVNFITAMFASGPMPVYNTIMQDVVPPEKRSSGAGVAIFIQYIIFTWWASTLVGKISDMFGGGAFGLRVALLAMCPLSVIGLLLFYRSCRTYPEDAGKYADANTTDNIADAA